MIWLLPIIIIGGIFFPVLGYLVLGMMGFLLVLSFFRERFWCWHLCPRGAFLDISVSRISPKKPLSDSFKQTWVRWVIFILFMGLVVFRILKSGGNILIIGSIFVSICLFTTVVSIIMGIFTHHRSWCAICPMGTAQEGISKINLRKKRKDR